MATSEELKRRAMDATGHRETAAHLRSFLKGGVRPPTSAPAPGGTVLEEVKRKAMSAVSNVETVAQVGLLKIAGGVAAYVGKIREANRDMHRARPDSRVPERTGRREDFERL